MRLHKLLERKHFDHQRAQNPVGRPFIDGLQRTGHGFLVLSDTQFRLAGEITDAMHKELNVFLERRAGRKWRLITALQTVKYQAATRGKHIAQH